MAKIFAGAKPWQIALIAIGTIGAVCGVGYVILSNDTPALVRVMTLADVTTGDVFELDITKHTAILPELNPKTGKASLIPIKAGEGGKWFADEKYLGGLEENIVKSALGEVSGNKVEVKLSGNKATLK